MKSSVSRVKTKPAIARGFKHLVPVKMLMYRKNAIKKSKLE